MRHLLVGIVLLSVLSLSSTGQVLGQTNPLMPGRSLQQTTGAPLSHEDSIKFEAAFKEIYPILRADPDVKEIARRYLKKLLRNATLHGLDSAKLYDSIMTNIDTNIDANMLRDVMGGSMTPSDIHALASFLKTPAGQHYLKIEWSVTRTRTELVDRAVARYLSMIIGPLRNRPEEPAPTPGIGQPPPHIRGPVSDSAKIHH